MLLSSWAKLKRQVTPFNGIKIDEVLIARGVNDNNERVLYFVLGQSQGFSVKTIERVPVVDVQCRVSDCNKVRWLLDNLDAAYLAESVPMLRVN